MSGAALMTVGRAGGAHGFSLSPPPPTVARVTDALAAALSILRCPHCGSPLSPGADTSDAPGSTRALRSVRCERGHTIDVARQGYVNLLTGAGAKGLAADTPAMVQARAHVHEAGVFTALAEHLAGLAAREQLGPGGVLDLGCGTGYYTAAVLDALGERVGVGLDLSTAAVKRAARAHPRLAAVVADAWAPLPLADASIALAMCVFAPRHPAELHRVLAPGGRLVVVTPGPGHLRSLVDDLHLLEVDPAKEERLARQLSDFTHVRTDVLDYEVAADRDLALAMIAMGPSAWHHTPEELAATIAAGPATRRLDICVRIGVFERT